MSRTRSVPRWLGLPLVDSLSESPARILSRISTQIIDHYNLSCVITRFKQLRADSKLGRLSAFDFEHRGHFSCADFGDKFASKMQMLILKFIFVSDRENIAIKY